MKELMFLNYIFIFLCGGYLVFNIIGIFKNKNLKVIKKSLFIKLIISGVILSTLAIMTALGRPLLHIVKVETEYKIK